jgi:FtsP/CotA-like multicopper oxidase with cupredoxin domain
MEPRFKLARGKRYRWRMRDASDDIHSMHIHRHSFEITRIAGKATTGIIKDVRRQMQRSLTSGMGWEGKRCEAKVGGRKGLGGSFRV